MTNRQAKKISGGERAVASISNLSFRTDVPLGSPKLVCHSHNGYLPCHSSHKLELSCLSSGLTRCLVRSTAVAQRGVYDHNNECSGYVAHSVNDILLLLVFILAEPNMNRRWIYDK